MVITAVYREKRPSEGLDLLLGGEMKNSHNMVLPALDCIFRNPAKDTFNFKNWNKSLTLLFFNNSVCGILNVCAGTLPKKCVILDYRTGSDYWISLSALSDVLGIIPRTAGTLPMFSGVQYSEPVRYPKPPRNSDHQIA